MSKQSEAKLNQGYNENPIPRTCANCAKYESELTIHNYQYREFTEEKQALRPWWFRGEENGDLLEVGGEMNSSIIGASGDAAYRPAPTVYQVCPHCKRLLNGMYSGGSKGFCDEHGEVTPINSAVVNTHNYRQTVDWSAA